MISIKNKADCCGCNACGDACPRGAISFFTDGEGFWYPEVNKDLCVDCGICEKVCPCINECHSRKINKNIPDCFAVEHKSIDVVFQSTSGGAFSALADVVYAENGYVGGAIHNDDFSVSHFLSHNRDDLLKLRRSKDLQSNAEGFYINVRKALETGRKVLVCGVPCQIAGLINFLNQDYENLITVDLICAGVNSPLVWRKYLDYIEEINCSKIIWTENKSKEYGWNNLTQKFVFDNGGEYFDTRKTSLFTQGYIESHLYCRPSCYECKFKGFPRVADITIGDYWGINKFSNKHKSDMGTNLVLINSQKGEAFFSKAKRRVNYESTPLDWALPGNPSLMKSISVLSDKREEFFADLHNIRFDRVVEKYSIKKLSRTKQWLKKKFIFLLHILKTTRLCPCALYQTIKYSGINNLLHERGIICSKNCHINVDISSHLEFDGVLTFGRKDKFPHSNQESRLFLGKNALLKICGDFEIDADCEVIVFEDAELIIHGGKIGVSDANSGLTIVCGQKIEIMEDVGIGRKVTIRDTNGGGHYINTAGYRPSRPVIIGEKTWLCEGCTVMPGAKIGRGVIVSGFSVVTKSIPDHTLVSGIPAEVVQEKVLWKL